MSEVPEWMESLLASPELSVATLPAAFLIGALAAMSSSCTLPILGAVTGYSAAHSTTSRRETVITSMAFMVGTFGALVVVGAIAGFAGQVPGVMGRYWKLFAGIVSILFGAAALGLLRFKIPAIAIPARPAVRGPAGAAIFGSLVGGATTACTVTCNPSLAGLLGLTVLKGKVLWGAAVLGAFAVGYSLPLAAVLAGLSFGKSRIARRRIAGALGMGGGVVLMALGFYFLATF